MSFVSASAQSNFNAYSSYFDQSAMDHVPADSTSHTSSPDLTSTLASSNSNDATSAHPASPSGAPRDYFWGLFHSRILDLTRK